MNKEKALKVKEELLQILEDAKKIYPEITDDMLDENGAIFYANGRNGTDFDFNVNNHLPHFCIYHKNESGYISVSLSQTTRYRVCIYKEGELEPTKTYEVESEYDYNSIYDFASLLYSIADKDDIYNANIETLDWNRKSEDCFELPFYDDEDDWF